MSKKKFEDSLNQEQQQAIKYISGPLLVLAGAGSGKTKVITKKITYLIKECSYKAHSICAVTFTNKAAQEMQSRIKKELPSSLTRGLKVATFHSLGLDIIKKNLAHLGLHSGFSIFDNEDSMQIIRASLPSNIGQDKDLIKQVMRTISLWKNNLQGPSDPFPTSQNVPTNIDMRAIYANYQATLLAYNAVDFDDLIYLPVKLFREQPNVLEAWQTKIRHLLIDEYQDSNSCQYELVKLLIGIRARFTVVGDDDQAIYAWRGARPENIIQLQKDFPELKVIKLEQNYRSTQKILHAANHLIQNNPHLFSKKLWSQHNSGDLIRILTCEDEQNEAEQVITDMISHKLQKGTTFSQYALLYRSNHQARVFEKSLRKYNIAYQISGGQSWFSKSEIKDVLAYFKLISNFDDDAAFLRIINTPKRAIGDKTIKELASFAKQRELSLFACCDNIGLSNNITPKSFTALQTFKNWIQTTANNINSTNDFLQACRVMLNDINYEDHLYALHTNPQKTQRCMDNAWELCEWINNIFAKNPSFQLSDCINQLILVDIIDKAEDSHPDTLKLMTLHAAKGLEFLHVYLVGVEENILPHHVSIESDDIQEERRLAYVGITRAQKTLTLSFAKRRKQGATLQATSPSRFLDELPEDCIEWYGNQKVPNPEQSKKIANLHLSGLKSILGENT